MLEKLLKKATLLDVLIILISSVAIVGFWRGTWNLLDYFLFPSSPLLSSFVSLLLGIIILIILSRYN
jgi:hypothetical protein